MTTAEWIAASIAVPAVGAIIVMAKQVVKAYIKQMEVQSLQLKVGDGRQTQITNAFIDHVEKQTATLGDIANVLKEIIKNEEAQGALVETLTRDLTQSLQKQMNATLSDHKKIWKTIGDLCIELKCSRLVNTEEAHTRTAEAMTRTEDAHTRAEQEGKR